MAKNYEIDNVDLKILNLLSEDAKMPYTEVAKEVYVSGGTVHVRMKKMEGFGSHAPEPPRKAGGALWLVVVPVIGIIGAWAWASLA